MEPRQLLFSTAPLHIEAAESNKWEKKNPSLIIVHMTNYMVEHTHAYLVRLKQCSVLPLQTWNGDPEGLHLPSLIFALTFHFFISGQSEDKAQLLKRTMTHEKRSCTNEAIKRRFGYWWRD